MNISLKKKYRSYTESVQYSYGRRHNGNGRREGAGMRQHPITSPQPEMRKTMVMDGLTGKSHMTIL